jgi:hypothetical protein
MASTGTLGHLDVKRAVVVGSAHIVHGPFSWAITMPATLTKERKHPDRQLLEEDLMLWFKTGC